ncbi:hypothetical protein BU15DRAFT_76199 [Melanogaster broomeanus]|nr:hypothetical protein BU15DRAFT_76199 [Melanogaster broomeanus]
MNHANIYGSAGDGPPQHRRNNCPSITDGGIFVWSLPPGKGRNGALDKYKNLGMTGYRVAQHCVDAIWTLNSDAYSSVYIPPTDWKEVMNRCIASHFFLLELLTGPDLVGIPDYHLSSLRHLLAKESVESSSTSKEWSIHAALAAVLALDQNEIVDNVPLASYRLDSLTSIMSAIRDLSVRGTLDNGEELGAMFASHFEQVSQGTSSSKFASQFAPRVLWTCADGHPSFLRGAATRESWQV